MTTEDILEFQWALAAVLVHAENNYQKGSYELKQTQMMHATLNREWRKLRDEIDAAMEPDNAD